MAPSVAPLLIGYLFYRKCGKYENIGGSLDGSIAHWFSFFMGNVENVKNIGGSLGGSRAHWFSVLW